MRFCDASIQIRYSSQTIKHTRSRQRVYIPNELSNVKSIDSEYIMCPQGFQTRAFAVMTSKSVSKWVFVLLSANTSAFIGSIHQNVPRRGWYTPTNTVPFHPVEVYRVVADGSVLLVYKFTASRATEQSRTRARQMSSSTKTTTTTTTTTKLALCCVGFASEWSCRYVRTRLSNVVTVSGWMCICYVWHANNETDTFV